MLPSRPIIGFFLKFLLVYGVSIVSWPAVYETYRACFKAGGEFVFRVIWHRDVVRFEPLAKREPLSGNETKVFVEQKGSVSWKSMSICIRDIGYLSTVVLAALVFATPVSRLRRGRALTGGILLLHGIIALRMLILVAALSSLNTVDPWLMRGTFMSKAAHAAIMRLALGQPFAYIVAIGTWMLVTLRREDLAMVLPDRGDGKPKDTARSLNVKSCPDDRCG